MFYAPSTNGFYSLALHGAGVPEDAVEITDERHLELIEGQSLGREIFCAEDGMPALRDRPALEPKVPDRVTSRQCELALLDAELLDDVEEAVAGLDRRSQIEWRTKTVVERDSPLVRQLAESLNIDLDSLFTEAAKL